MKLLRYFFLLIMQAFCLYSFSQNERIKFEHIGTTSGLSQSNVLSIFQDSRGFMWFGTSDGLNKYDGYTFTVYKHNEENKNTLSNNAIANIAEDEKGNIWLATWGSGLDMFDWKKEIFTHYTYKVKDPTGIGGNYINKLFRDSQDNLWIGTESGGLNMYDKKSNKFIQYRHDDNDPKSLSNDWVKDIVEDGQHNLWIGTAGGLNLFDKTTKTFTHYQHDAKNSKSISGNIVWILFKDSRDRLWIGMGGEGLDLFDKKKNEFIHFKNNPGNSNSLSANFIKAISDDEHGNLWIGTENGGLNVLDPLSGRFDNYLKDDIDNASLSSNSIASVFRDKKGNMWTGTYSGGINLASYDANKFAHYSRTSIPFSLSNNIVLSIFEDAKANLWIGTDGGGLNLFDNKKGTFTTYKHDAYNKNSICGNYVLNIFEDSEGNLWIGTWGDGITVFNKEKNTFRHFKYDPSNPKGIPNPNIWSISEDADKNIWIGTYGGGISQYDRKNDNFITYSFDVSNPTGLGNNYVNIIYGDKKGNLWIGTNGSGLDLFNKNTKTFTHFRHEEGKAGLSNNHINCLAEDGDGNLWIGTSLGLNRMDAKTRQFINYNVKDGLPGNTIAGLLIDGKGDLWLSTYNGLSQFNVATKTFKNFDINDGLQSNEFKMNSCYRSRSGKMYFGGINGFNAFFPDSIKEKKYEPPLVFTGFQIFNKQVQINKNENDKSLLKQSITDTKELVLPYDQSVISFEFASLNYVFQNKKQYSYMLEGFDKGWNDVGTRHTATYTNLDPRKYMFKVRGMNNEGNWSSNIATLQLTITPPFWLTWWFRILVIVFIIAVVIAFYKFRIRLVKAQQIKLQRKVDEQTRQLLQSTEEEHKARQEAETARQETEHANTELERKNKELEQFAYVASHDMQEPLRTTSSFVELLQQQYQGRLDEKADKYLTFIAQSSHRMKALITDLLDYSRIGRKKELVSVDCNLIVKEVLADIEVAIKESGAVIKSGDLPVINGYATELKQLFQNLLINALKFRKENIAPEIKIEANRKNGCWEFTCQDNGIGIDKQHQERIFVIFQRLHTRTEYEGSGIGLSNCRKIVELHRGKIWVESSPGNGSTFHFTIHQNNIGK
jgi:signal transduction histidine kinase/ligand-binding sensor domain-containing protein